MGADDKDLYSEAAKYYVETVVPSNDVDQERHNRSKERETKYNDNWCKQKANLNDIVKKFDATKKAYAKNIKYVFEGDKYKIKADLSAGYLRIYDKEMKKNVKLDGTCGTEEETHFKIMRREEM